MLGLLSGLLGGAIAPLIDQVSTFSARLLRKVALFLVAAVCAVVVLIALTIAFDLWIATLAGPIVGALAVALLYFLVAAASIVLALRDGRSKTDATTQAEAQVAPERGEEIDRFTSPLMRLLGQLGLRREQLAVLAGGSLAKKIGPLPLVGLAIVAGFLIGRTWKTWKNLVSIETLTSLMSVAGLFGLGNPQSEDADDVEV